MKYHDFGTQSRYIMVWDKTTTRGDVFIKNQIKYLIILGYSFRSNESVFYKKYQFNLKMRQKNSTGRFFPRLIRRLVPMVGQNALFLEILILNIISYFQI